LVDGVRKLLLHLCEKLHLTSKARDLLCDPVRLGFSDVALLTIRPVQRSEVTRDAGVDLFHSLADLSHREVLVAIVDGLKLAAIDRNNGETE
jgi:hypothetical protein